MPMNLVLSSADRCAS